MHFTLRSKALYFALFSGLSYGVYRWASGGSDSAAAPESAAAAPGAALGIPGAALAPRPAVSALTTPQPLLALLQEAAAAAAGMASGTAAPAPGIRLRLVRVCLAKPGCSPAEAAAALPAFLQRLQEAAAQGAVELSVALEPAVYDHLRSAAGGGGGRGSKPAPRAETCVPGIVGADLMATAAALSGDGSAQPWTTASGTHLTAAEHASQYCAAPSAQLPSAAGTADAATAGHVLLLMPEGPAAEAMMKVLKGGHGWYGPPLWQEQALELPLAQVQLHPAGGAFVTASTASVQLSSGQALLQAATDGAGAEGGGLAWWYAPSAGQLAMVLGGQ